MKFGQKINVRSSYLSLKYRSWNAAQTDLYNEWKPFYLNYNGLKRVLKVGA